MNSLRNFQIRQTRGETTPNYQSLDTRAPLIGRGANLGRTGHEEVNLDPSRGDERIDAAAEREEHRADGHPSIDPSSREVIEPDNVLPPDWYHVDGLPDIYWFYGEQEDAS